MKAFETPFVDVKKFDIMDVLTASTPAPTAAPATTEEPDPIIECVGWEID